MSKLRPNLDLVSLDLAPARFPRAADVLGVKIIQLDIEHTDPADLGYLGKFQCVVLCEMFEHFRINILHTVTTVGELIGPTGILYLTMPNGLGFSAWRTKFARGRTGPSPVAEWRKLSDLGHMGHVREYSFRELQEVLEACRLRVDRYFWRRRTSYQRTARSRIRDIEQIVATGLVPSLGDEIVVVARSVGTT